VHCFVMEDNYGYSLGFGFVEFDSKDSAVKAYKTMDRARFNGVRIHIS
jgi:RNA recognition motif-containing protein